MNRGVQIVMSRQYCDVLVEISHPLTMLQLKEAEERRLSRSCSKSPGIRIQDSPIHFPQTLSNPDHKTPELKILDGPDPKTPADDTSDANAPKLKSLEASSLKSGEPISPPEEIEVKNPDTDMANEAHSKVQAIEKEPKPKPRRKPQ